MTLDKLTLKNGTDKASTWHNYTKIYSKYLSNLKNDKFSLLEIGIGGSTYAGKMGGSLKTWSDYFNNAEIHGIDVDPICSIIDYNNVFILIGNQTDNDFLNNIIENMNYKLTVIIDDGSHINKKTIASFEHLFKKLEAGGLYFIEDIHCTYEKKFNNERKDFDAFILKLIKCVDTNGKKLTLHNMQDFDKIPSPNNLNYYERWVEAVFIHKGLYVVKKRDK